MQNTVLDRIFRKLRSLVVVMGFAILSMVLTGSLAAAQTYRVTDLGVLPGDTGSLGDVINSSGQVVGCSDTSIDTFPCLGGSPGHAFLWSKATGMRDLGTLPGGTFSVAFGLNDPGQAVGWSNNGQGAQHAFIWTQSRGMRDLGTLPGGTYSYAFAINSVGLICGFGDSGTSNGVGDVVIWTADKEILDLGSLPGVLNSQAIFINDHNQFVGAALYSNGTFQAFAGTISGGLTALPTLPGATTSLALGVNDAGIIVGSSNSAKNSNGIAVAWDSNLKIYSLGTLPGDSASSASYINDLDQAVGQSTTPSGVNRAVIWTKSGIQNLNNLIPRNSGWTLVYALSINRAGQITGYGTINGQNHAFLLTPF